jgi:hypothetical protein
MNRICIVGKGSSLLCQQLGKLIDSYDTVIRINHLPDENYFDILGKKTNILSTRSNFKLAANLDEAKAKNLDIWVCSSLINNYQNIEAKFINSSESLEINKYFNNCLSLQLNKNDSQVKMIMPDTGITTILLTLLRFPNYTIDVCGFDLYKNGNHQIHTSKNSSSIFLTPVFQQMIFYKMLINKGIISELKKHK